MLYLAFIAVTFCLLAGFIALTHYETRSGVRFFAPRRIALDEMVERMHFIVEHVDLAAFLREEMQHAAHIVSHAIVTASLQAVRAIERVLTRLVRHLRSRSENMEVPHESAREFVKTLSDFKGTLKSSYPGVPEIE